MVPRSRIDLALNPYRVRPRATQIRVPVWVADLLRMADFSVMYRRDHGGTIYVRDSYGRYITLRGGMHNLSVGPSRDLSLGPTYGRVDYGNSTRFTGRVRSQDQLEQAFNRGVPQKASPMVALPSARNVSRREPNQGMNAEMYNIFANAWTTATEYATQCLHLAAAPVPGYEWCHLIAHSMGGPDDPNNIVAARKGNNSEQLAIENTLSAYRRENLFNLQVTAAVPSNGIDRHLGDVIEYAISTHHETFSIYLDCAVGIAPSGIHHSSITRQVAQWCNTRCAVENDPGELAPAEQRAVMAWWRGVLRQY